MGSGGRTGADKGEDVFLRQERERVLIWAAEYSLAHPVSSALRGRLQDEVSEYPRAHVVRGGAGWGLPADCPEKEPGTARVGIVPGGVGLAVKCVVREGLEWGWVVLVRSAAAGHARLKLGERLLEIRFCVETGGERKETGICGGIRRLLAHGDDVAGRMRIICQSCPLLDLAPCLPQHRQLAVTCLWV